MNVSKIIDKSPKKSAFKCVFSEIDAWGKQKAEICFELKGNIENVEAEEHVLQIQIMDELVKGPFIAYF